MTGGLCASHKVLFRESWSLRLNSREEQLDCLAVMDSLHHQLEYYQEERTSSRTVGSTGRRGIWRGAKKVSDTGSKTGV